ncbi:hypothetical protein ES703_112929 [subsurface metagenome]
MLNSDIVFSQLLGDFGQFDSQSGAAGIKFNGVVSAIKGLI